MAGPELHRRGKLRDIWGRWRERRRQYQLERALFKAAGGVKQFPEHQRDGGIPGGGSTPGV